MKLYLVIPALLYASSAYALGPMQVHVGASTRIGDDIVTYSETSNQDVPIALPTTRYTCVRKATIHHGSLVGVLISCMEGTREGFVVGAVCDQAEEAEHLSIVTVNVSTTEKSLPVTFTAACKTSRMVGTWT